MTFEKTRQVRRSRTVCTVAVGGTAKGSLDYELGLDEDGWSVMLEGGQTYQIDLKGFDTGDGALGVLIDPWVLLFDSGDNFLTDDVGGGVGRNARITYTVPRGQGGIFYIYASLLQDPARREVSCGLRSEGTPLLRLGLTKQALSHPQ